MSNTCNQWLGWRGPICGKPAFRVVCKDHDDLTGDVIKFTRERAECAEAALEKANEANEALRVQVAELELQVSELVDERIRLEVEIESLRERGGW